MSNPSWPPTVLVIASSPIAAFKRLHAWRRQLGPEARLVALLGTRLGLRQLGDVWLYPLPKGPRASLLQEIEAFDADAIDVGAWDSRRARAGLFAHLRGSPQIVERVQPVTALPSRRYDPALLVSIVLPVYNGADYLDAAISTTLAQTHRAFELIVVDDGSKDASRDIAARWAARDPRVQAHANERNSRVPTTLNHGFARARGSLLTWTSHDNLYQPTALEAMVRVFSTYPEVDFVYGDYRVIDEHGRFVRLRRVPTPDTLGERNGIGPYFMYRRSVYERVGGFRPGLDFVDDYDYWLRVQRSGAVMRNLHLPLYDYREHSAAATAEIRRNRALQAEIDRRIAEVQNATLVSWWPAEANAAAAQPAAPNPPRNDARLPPSAGDM